AVLGRARSVSLASGQEEDPTGAAVVVARSDAQSFRAHDASRTRAGRVTVDPTRDEAGPVGVIAGRLVPPAPGAAVPEGRGGDGAREGRIVLVGDADFASDNFFRLHGNQALLLRAIAWLTPEGSTFEGPQAPAADIAPLSALYVSQERMREIFTWTAL